MVAPDPRPAAGGSTSGTAPHVRPRHPRSDRDRPLAQTVGESEPLDCDEAAYAYIGHRVLRGDVLYRDLTENKPPLGYWIYTLAVAIGGYDELAIRIMPIPFVLATIAVVWWIALRLGGPGSACLAAGLIVLLSTDPYLFGNGSNLEHFINFFAVAVAGDVHPRLGPRRSPVARGGRRLPRRGRPGQTGRTSSHALVFVPALLVRAWAVDGPGRRRESGGLLDVLAFGLGIASIVGLAGGDLHGARRGSVGL